MKTRIAGIILLLSTLAGPLEASDIDTWLAQLNSRQSKDRTEAEAQLKQHLKPGHLPKLVAFFRTCEMMASYVVVRLVDEVGGAPAKAALSKMVSLRTDYGAFYAANSLKYRHQDGSGYAYLLEKIRNPKTPENFRYLLMSYVSSMGQAGRALMVNMAADGALSSRLRVRALERLADQTYKPDEAKVVASLQQVEDPKVRVAGDVYLYTRGKLQDVPRLDAAVTGGKLDYSQCYTFLRAVEKKKDKQRKAALLYLSEKGQSGYIKANALRTLAKVGLAETAVKQAQKHLNAKDSYLKREARRLMVQYGRTSIEDLKKQLASGSMSDRVDAAELLLKLDDYSGESVVIQALADRNVVARRKAAEISRMLLSRSLLVPLVKALDDDDQTVRMYAHSSFRHLLGAMFPYRNLDWKKLGYTYNAAKQKRQSAVGRLTEWLAKQVSPPGK